MTANYYYTLTLHTCVFTLLWLLLSASFGWLHMIMGLVVSLCVAWLNTERTGARVSIRVWRMFWYFLWLVGRILHSGFHLSGLILHPALPIDPKMIRHRCALRDDPSTVLLGNSITLTPGTITVELDSRELLVHTMDDVSADDVTSRRLEERIDGLFVVRDLK